MATDIQLSELIIAALQNSDYISLLSFRSNAKDRLFKMANMLSRRTRKKSAGNLYDEINGNRSSRTRLNTSVGEITEE